MKNYKININRTPLTDDDINKGKNFNEVLKNYQAVKTPFIKTTKFWFGASSVLVASVASLILFKTLSPDTDIAPATAFINPPVAEANIATDKYTVNTESDSTIVYKSGSKIHVPAHAFLDANGNEVKGKVELSYREFQKISEVFLAGIPMTYDSAGQQYHFETAGMMEIGAEQNGKPVYTNPAALIKVDMVSSNSEDRFNTYYLDTVEKKWKYLTQTNYNQTAATPSADSIGSEMQSSETVSPAAAALQAELKKVQKEMVAKPVEPKKIDTKKERFSIKVDEKEFPEIAVYNNIKFQVEDNTYNPAKADITWENVELKRIQGGAKYEITFSNSKENYKVVAVPVVSDKDYAEAKKIYDQKFSEYHAKLEQRKADEARIKAKMEAEAKAAQERIQQQLAEMEERRKQYEANLKQSELVYRSFIVNNFGVWNSDCPRSLPSGEALYAHVINAKTKTPLQVQSFYLVEKGRNAMFSYYPTNLNQFRYDKTKDNMVWAVTSDLKVAVLKPEQFKAAKTDGKNIDLELNVIDEKFSSSEQAKQYLEI